MIFDNQEKATIFEELYLCKEGRFFWSAKTCGIVSIWIFQNGIFHSARPAKYLPLISRSAFKQHVKLALEHGIRFNYLLNGTSYANAEYTHGGRTELEELLQFLCDCGVSSVTVTAPYIIDII